MTVYMNEQTANRYYTKVLPYTVKKKCAVHTKNGVPGPSRIARSFWCVQHTFNLSALYTLFMSVLGALLMV